MAVSILEPALKQAKPQKTWWDSHRRPEIVIWKTAVRESKSAEYKKRESQKRLRTNWGDVALGKYLVHAWNSQNQTDQQTSWWHINRLFWY